MKERSADEQRQKFTGYRYGNYDDYRRNREYNPKENPYDYRGYGFVEYSPTESKNEPGKKPYGFESDQRYRVGQAFGAESNSLSERSGTFVGKGPRGFNRVDVQILEQVCSALTSDPDVDASNMEVNVKCGIVNLRGIISNRRMKRLAEECVERISGVVDVQNELRVLKFIETKSTEVEIEPGQKTSRE